MVSIVALTFIAGDYQAQVMVVLMFALFLTLLIVPIFLVINGVVMIRREGHSLANLLSLGLGLVVGIGEIAAYLALVMPQISVPGLDGRSHFVEFTRFGMFLSASVFYFSMTFVVFMTYCVFLQILPLRKEMYRHTGLTLLYKRNNGTAVHNGIGQWQHRRLPYRTKEEDCLPRKELSKGL